MYSVFSWVDFHIRNLIYIDFLYFQPFNATRIAASGIDSRVKQLTKDTSNKNEDKNHGKGGFWDEFEVRSDTSDVLGINLGIIETIADAFSQQYVKLSPSA